MLFYQDISDLLLPNSVYFVVFILFICVYAFRHVDTRLGQMRYVLAALSVWAYVFTIPALANSLIMHLEQEYPPHDVRSEDRPGLIVVLASGFDEANNKMLDEEGWERTYAGVRLWRNVGGTLLFVGGSIRDTGVTAAEFMAVVANDLGVPKANIRVEGKSRNTHQNLLLSRDLISSFGERAWLVTSALHMPRAMAVAGKLGLRLRAYPCDYRGIKKMGWRAWFPNSGAIEMYSAAIHELIGLSYYRVSGQAI